MTLLTRSSRPTPIARTICPLRKLLTSDPLTPAVRITPSRLTVVILPGARLTHGVIVMEMSSTTKHR